MCKDVSLAAFSLVAIQWLSYNNNKRHSNLLFLKLNKKKKASVMCLVFYNLQEALCLFGPEERLKLKS